MVKKNIVFLSVFAILLFGVSYFVSHERHKILPLAPMKCKAFSKVEMETEYGNLTFSIIENIQLYGEDKGLMQFEGYVTNGTQRTYLDRTAFMHNTTPDEPSDFVFLVEKFERSGADTTPDELFNQMWLELAGNDNLLNVSITELKNNAFTVISPYAPQFTCAAY